MDMKEEPLLSMGKNFNERINSLLNLCNISALNGELEEWYISLQILVNEIDHCLIEEEREAIQKLDDESKTMYFGSKIVLKDVYVRKVVDRNIIPKYNQTFNWLRQYDIKVRKLMYQHGLLTTIKKGEIELEQ